MCSTHFAEEAAPTTGRDGAHAHLRHARRTSHPNCTPCRGPHVKSACAWLCTGTPTDVKSDDLQATMCSTPLVCTTWYHAVPPLPPCRTSATATHAAGDCARAPSGHNGCPRCTNCLTPGPDASSDCGDFAEEALASSPMCRLRALALLIGARPGSVSPSRCRVASCPSAQALPFLDHSCHQVFSSRGPVTCSTRHTW